jgi:hypothetical protein
LGVDVRFVQEGLDLRSRGGRLAADIQAVVAADYVRNLRDETRKGMRGRFRQGLYPLPAPIGYINNGRAQPKTPDPVRAPLIQQAFELYASGLHSLESLQLDLYIRGLRNRLGMPVSINGLSRMLKNSFYVGDLRLRSTGEMFLGVHQPLIERERWNRVQDILHRRARPRVRPRHRFRFRGLLRCSKCNRVLTGELQKGRVYYRCHRCCGTCMREDRVRPELLRCSDGSNPGRGDTECLDLSNPAM